MRKTHWTALAAALLLGVSALAGCSKNEGTLDVQKAADALKAGVTFSSAAPVYKPTGERIRRYEIYYQAADKPALCAAVSSGDMERLVNIPRNDKSSSLLLTLYATESGSFSMGQVSQYVPHAFEPVTDVVRFSAEQGKLAVGLV